MEKTDIRFAVLIDADNISAKKIKDILDEIAKYGTPTIKRIYGDFTDVRLTPWKSVLLDNSITPIQQYAYTTGKNATDSALIIDAMDILHRESVDGFCIVSSDSDFTRLASRLRESGKQVLGFGEKKTPQPFIKSCDKFIYVEILGDTVPAMPAKAAKRPAQKKTAAGSVSPAPKPESKPVQENSGPAVDKQIIDLLISTIDDVADDSGWAFLGTVGGIVTKKMPDFDPRNYGFKKLTPLVRSLSNRIEVEERKLENSDAKYLYVRNKMK